MSDYRFFTRFASYRPKFACKIGKHGTSCTDSPVSFYQKLLYGTLVRELSSGIKPYHMGTTGQSVWDKIHLGDKVWNVHPKEWRMFIPCSCEEACIGKKLLIMDLGVTVSGATIIWNWGEIDSFRQLQLFLQMNGITVPLLVKLNANFTTQSSILFVSNHR